MTVFHCYPLVNCFKSMISILFLDVNYVFQPYEDGALTLLDYSSSQRKPFPDRTMSATSILSSKK